jgi:hypothetical protein
MTRETSPVRKAGDIAATLKLKPWEWDMLLNSICQADKALYHKVSGQLAWSTAVPPVRY